MQKIFLDIDMSKVTLVSALFNIKREEMDGRTWEEYLKWFDITLKLKCPMVLFVSGDLLSFVEKRRKDIPTKTIVQNIEEIPYYYLKDKMDSILQSEDYKKWQAGEFNSVPPNPPFPIDPPCWCLGAFGIPNSARLSLVLEKEDFKRGIHKLLSYLTLKEIK